MITEIEAFVDPFGRCNVANAALVLQRSPQTMANWRTQGLGPDYFKVGGTVFYKLSDLRAFALGETPAKRPAPRVPLVASQISDAADTTLKWLHSKRPHGLFSLPCIYMKGPRQVRNKSDAEKVVGALLANGLANRLAGRHWVDKQWRNECYRLTS